jgi:hypothetical protein
MATAPPIDSTLFPFGSKEDKAFDFDTFAKGDFSPYIILWGARNKSGCLINCYTFTTEGKLITQRDWVKEGSDRTPDGFHQMLKNNQLSHKEKVAYKTRKCYTYFGFTPEACAFVAEFKKEAYTLYGIGPDDRENAFREKLKPLIDMCPSITDEHLTAITAHLARDWNISFH